MGWRQSALRAFALGIGLAAISVMAVLPSAAAKSSAANRGEARAANLTTVPAIKSYLRSVGVDTKGLVVQRGARNYAGLNCPGPNWNCTQSRKVVQVSAFRADDDDDGDNRFECRLNRGTGTRTQDASPPDQSCVIMQTASTTNSATCEIETTSTAPLVSQACVITQSGNSNTAVAKLVATLRGNAASQDVRQRIEVLQTGGSSGNNLTATQTARVNAGSGGDDDDDDDDDLRTGSMAAAANVSRSQDFHQVVCANQQSSGNGANVARVTQDGRATATFQNVDDVEIDQNTDEVASTCIGPAAPFANLTPDHIDQTNCPIESDSSGTPKVSANTCARVQQDAASGRNTITQDQTSRLQATVERAGVVDISQGSETGGIESTQDQESSGISRIEDEQEAEQIASVRRVDGFDLDQIEDPRCCAGGHQLGNSANRWSLEQDLTQRARVNGDLVDPDNVSGGSASQHGANYGNCTTTGSCTVEQRLSNNVETETNSCTGSSCDVFIDCTATGGEGGGSEFCTTEDDVEVSNTASASSETPDPNTENNSDTTTTLVVGDGPVSLTAAVKASGSATQAITPEADALDLANAIAADSEVVVGAEFVAVPEGATPNAVADSGLADFPTNGETYAILTSGDPALADDENTAPNSGANLGGGPVRPAETGTDRDATILRIDLDVPEGPNCLTFEFRFLSEEFPEFVPETFPYNDAFIAELDESTWMTSGSTITADDNFAFDPSENVISIRAAGATSMTEAQAAGTTYDGATPLLSASTDVTEGEHSLYLSIFDQGDNAYDSAVFVDNLVLGTTGPGGCEEGAEPTETADLAVSMEDSPDPVEGGETLTYEITVSNAGPDTAEAVTLLDTLPGTFVFGEADPSQGICTQVLAVSCALGSIAPESSATVTITVTA